MPLFAIRRLLTACAAGALAMGCGDAPGQDDGAGSSSPPDAGQVKGPTSSSRAEADGTSPPQLAIEVSDALLKRLASLSPLPALPADPTNAFADDEAAADLGQALFFDERLSKDGTVSCATCHDPAQAFTDGRQLALGQSLGNRHTPTLLNVAYHRWLTWDGRADSLWMQALDPMEDPREMGTSRGHVALTIAGDQQLRAEFEEVFGALPEAALSWGTEETRAVGARPRRAAEAVRADGEDPAPGEVRAWEALEETERDALTTVYVQVGKAMAAYQRRLISKDAPFDRFVEGLVEGDPAKQASLSAAAQRGLLLFVGRGNCTLCHNGPNFSDGEFHNNSLPTLHGGEPVDPGRYAGAAVLKASQFNASGPYSDDTSGPDAQDVQRLRVTSESWGEFRTPSLRNLAGRAPFMHQGQLPDLAAVIDFYSELEGATGRNHHQEQILVPLRLGDREKADLLAFLKSLNGQALPDHLLRSPRK